MVDIHEIDNCYYGLFKDVESNGEYVLFRTSGEDEGGIVHRLPFEVSSPELFTSSDSLYSLFAVVNGEDEGRPFL